jgi:molybdate transport system substrate-binding protein
VSRLVAACAAALAAVIASGCGGDAGGEEPALTVSAASSLTEAFEAYADSSPGEEKLQFAGSDDLAAQIEHGAPVDVFASANTTYPRELHDQGLVEKPVVFATNELVLAVSRDSPLDFAHALAEISAPGLDLVIGAEGVPAGDYAREALARLSPAREDAILANVRSEESDVKGIVGKLATGAADAGFVYATDVEAAGDDLRAIELPAELQPVVAYSAAVVSDSEDRAAARKFIDALLSGDGADALAAAGFKPPPIVD